MQKPHEGLFSKLLSVSGLNRRARPVSIAVTPKPQISQESVPPVPATMPSAPPRPPQAKRKNSTEPPSLFLPTTLYEDKEILARAEDEIFAWAESQTGVTFTPSQRAFIVSPKRSTLVDAGAGSGKSTTLAWRILFMHRYCNIPLTEITVFSFTRASCDDLRKKISKTFNAFGIPVTNRDVRQLVRTFHSKVFEWSRATGLLSEKDRLFEFLDRKNDPSEDDDKGLDIDNPMNSGKLNKQQQRHVRQCHESLYLTCDSYQASIDELERQVLLQLSVEFSGTEMEEWKLDKYEGRDLALTKAGFEIFRELQHLTPVTDSALVLNTQFGNYTLNANYYFPEIDLYAVVVPNDKVCEKEDLVKRYPDINGRFLSQAFLDRAQAIKLYCEENVAFIETASDAAHVAEYVSRTASVGKRIVPYFKFKLGGDYGTKPLMDQLLDTATFTESVGVEVFSLNPIRKTAPLPKVDDCFIDCLCQFWIAWTQYLSDNNIVRFPALMQAFGNPDSTHFQNLPDRVLTSLKHVCIDEFQDISMLEVNWITATLKHLKSLPSPTSLTCVGDDYQSIYGWRGSSTAFFTEFERWFPTGQTGDRIVMEDNFRSFQNIVDTAESLLKSLSVTATKHGRCSNGKGGEGVKVEIYEYKNRAQIIEDALQRIHDYRSVLMASGEQEDASILVLCRSNDTVEVIRNAFDKSTEDEKTDDVRFETIHRSKGLESQYAVLMGDCGYDSHNPIRNMIYKSSGFTTSYDIAQSDEAMRLSYVGVTRAKTGVTWFGTARPDGAMRRLS